MYDAMRFYRPLTERGGVLPVYQVHLQRREYDLLPYPPQDFPHYTHFSDLDFQIIIFRSLFSGLARLLHWK